MSGYRNRSLFSDHYLQELVDEDSHWQALKKSAWEHRQRIANILEKALPGIDGDTPEAEVERRLIRPILDSLEHVYFVQPAVPSSEGVRRPDYAFFPSPETRQDAESHKGEQEFFKTALAVGDAKAWERSLDRRIKGPGDPFTNHNPSYQIDFYLRATDKRWGLITNGRHWRLYHRDVSYRLDVYYEVDLPQIIALDEDVFLYFLAFFHKEAFQPDGTGECFLDRAYRASTEYAAKVSEELKDNVYEALRLLAEGFLAFPGNNLKPQHLDLIRENAFIVIYRLLFILYAEAREFLPVANPTYFGTYSLRALTHEIATKEPFVANLHPTATGYWSRLQELFRLINNGDDFLRIPPYNGRLFDDQKEHRSLATWKIGDRYLAAAIDQLARARAAGRTGRGFVSYKDLSIRELGSVYEGLLEHRPRYATQDVAVVKEEKRERFVPLAELGNRKALKTYRAGSVYLETDKGERKATGSYYTPQYIVEYIVKNTLGPLLEEAKKSDGNLIEAILALKVLDPAMGSGHFLVEATDYLARALVEALGGDPREMEEDEIRWARREVVERCIYGVDLNPLAVDLAKLSLWLSTVSLDKPLNFLDHHLRCGNSLIGARLEDLGMLPELSKKAKRTAITTLAGHRFQEAIASAVSTFQKIAEAPSDSVEDIHRKESAYETARYALSRIKDIADVWTSVYFGNEVKDKDAYEQLLSLAEQDSSDWPRPGKVAWLGKARTIAQERRFFHWELEFPEVFFDRIGQRLPLAGFDVVVGNPPYDVLEKERLGAEDPHAELAQYLENIPAYYPALGGKVNLFRPFMVQEARLLRDDGFIGKIVPLAIANDFSCTRTRAHLLRETSLVKLECFPQKDDPRDRVFEDAKLSTCIPILRKLGSTTSFIVQIHPGRQFANDCKRVHVSLAEMQAVDPNVLPIPLVTQPAWDLAVRVHARWPICHISDLATLTRGEINQTIFAKFITSNPSHQEMIKGVEIDRFSEHWYLSQGEKQWFDESLYYRTTKPPKTIPNFRIGIQRISGIDDRIRLIATFFNRRVYFADSTNSIAADDSSKLYFLLALINSQFFNWRFKLTSTNNNVATNELNRLPVRRINFTTPKAERERLVGEGQKLYHEYLQSKDGGKVLSFVDQRLPQKPDGSPDTEREQSDVIHDLLAFLAEEMTRLHKEKQTEIKGFLRWLEGYLGVNVEDLKNKTRVKEYWKQDVGWEGFLGALEQNRRAIHSAKGLDVTRREPQETIRAELDASVAKLRPVLERIELTDRLIDSIVYKLYGLTEEEIAVVEGGEGG